MEVEERLDSDISSILSISSRPMASDSEHEDLQKYRMPEPPKTRTHPRSIPLPVRTSSYNLNHASSPDSDVPPPPPPKDDEPPSAVSSNYDPSVYFNPSFSRTNSIYTLSRVSFTSQIQQLTSIRLPDASSLAASIDAIPSAYVATRALNDAAEQIKRWIKKASEVLSGLDAEDDVEWAAAGKESLEDVNRAVTRFDELIQVYLTAIEKVQLRPDISALLPQDLEVLVDRMETITNDWNGTEGIKHKLEATKKQVDTALEWEELWNSVLGEIGSELEALGRFVFEMEERRHRSLTVDLLGEGGGNRLDIKELETIVEEAPGRSQARSPPSSGKNNRFSVAAFPTAQPEVQQQESHGEEANLIQLAARMQPLRASLEFLPMRLAPFRMKASDLFPTACDDLDRRRKQLDEKYKKLGDDAEALRRELGEDRWVLVFRNAGRQMLKMCESVGRTMEKLRDSLDEGEQHTDPPAIFNKIQTYENKKVHYGQAIERVLNVIDTGVRDRLTVNGEILTLQKEMRQTWTDLQSEMKAMDFVLVELNINKNNLRDSISTILSMDRSIASSARDTPGSSPASSVILTSRKSSDYGTPGQRSKSRQGSFASSTRTQTQAPAASRRYSSLPVTKNYGKDYMSPYSQKAIAVARSVSSTISETNSNSSIGSPRFGTESVTPTPGRRSVMRVTSDTPNKPRWNSSTNMNNTVVGHNFKPSSRDTPSQYRRETSPGTTSLNASFRASRTSAQPMPSPLGRPPSRSGASSSASNRPPSRLSLAAASTAMGTIDGSPDANAPATPATSRLAAPRVRPTASVRQLAKANAAASTSSALPKVRAASANHIPKTPVIGAVEEGAEAGDESPSVRTKRPTSAMNRRRSSMLPVMRRGVSGETAAQR